MRFFLVVIIYILFWVQYTFAQKYSFGDTYPSRLNGKSVCFGDLLDNLKTEQKNIDYTGLQVVWNPEIDKVIMDARFLA